MAISDVDRRRRDLERRVHADPHDRYARLSLYDLSRRTGRRLSRDVRKARQPKNRTFERKAADRDVLRSFRLFTESKPHEAQLRFYQDTSRFCAAVAGVQSGKSTIGASKFWRRIITENIPGAQYWMVAPDSIVGRVMRERFHAVAPRGWIQRPNDFSVRTMVWHLANGARVDFRSGERPEKLVGATLNGVWLDEFAQLKAGLWSSSARARLAATGGWALFTGTPRGKNWAWDEIWRLTVEGDDKDDPDWSGHTWHSSDSPRISKEEIESARRTLSAAYFRREWEASWDAFHGQIYGLMEDVHFIDPFDIVLDPRGYCLFAKDFGFAKPGHLAIIWKNTDGSYIFIDEVHEANKLDEWWDRVIQEKFEEHTGEDDHGLPRPPLAIHCDPSEPQRIMALRSLGLPAVAAPNQVHLGIRTVNSLIHREMFFISRACPHTIREFTGYRWQEDAKGRRREAPVKENDHSCDAGRYGIMGDGPGGGVRSKKIRRGRARTRARR